MGKKSRGHRPPQQSRVAAGNVPIIDPSARQKAEQQQQAMIEAKIQSLVAGIYTQNSPNCIDEEGNFDADLAAKTLENAFDAAVVFARNVWGLNVQRNPTVAEQEKERDERMSNPPQPILE